MMYKTLLLLTLVFVSLSAKDVFNKNELKEFNSFKKFQTNAFRIDKFQTYKKAQNNAFNSYKKDLLKFWKTPKLSTKKEWVSYTKDMRTRTDVDFSKETIDIQTIASSKREAKDKIKRALKRAITIDTKTVQESDPLQKILDAIKTPNGVVKGSVISEPILSTVIFDKKPTKKTIKAYVEKKIIYNNIKIKKNNKNTIYSINIKLPSDIMIKRSKIFYSEVKKQAKLQKIPLPLIFAIIHTESNFNPRARSPIPAFGLMQIVPRTAGIDSYFYLYKEKKLVSATFLYNSRNNITMGSAYLHLLYYKYLRGIKNQDSKLFCTIAAYNTGTGNVAWVFTKTNDINKASLLINKMSSKQVYNKLLRGLKYDETKHYLKKVRSRIDTYHKIYEI